MTIFSRRTLYAYAVILGGMSLYMLRRLFLPTFFETEGVPFAISSISALSACYAGPTINTCSDAVIVTLSTFGVVAAASWGSPGRTIFALILAVLPLGFYLIGSSIWITLILLVLLPLAIDLGVRLLIPRQAS